jgi:hypothetical protein
MTRQKQKCRTETWKGRRVKVARNPNGRFVSWHRIRPYRHRQAARHWAASYERRQFALLQGQKRVAVYGTTRNARGIVRRNRIEIAGSGNDLYNAVEMMFEGYIPRRPYTIKRAEDIDPDDFEWGYWIEGPEVESH